MNGQFLGKIFFGETRFDENEEYRKFCFQFLLANIWIGVAITMAGIVLIATEGEPARILELQINKGDALVFLGAAIYAAFTLALRKRPAMSAMAFFIGVAIAALLSSAPAMLAEAMLGAAVWPGWRGLLVLLYVSVWFLFFILADLV